MAWADSKNPRARRLPADWAKRRRQVMRRDRNTCVQCGDRATDVDHIVRGDNHALENLQAMCRPCHARKTASESGKASAAYNRARAASKYRPREPHPGTYQ